jgi:hypothetical protein
LLVKFKSISTFGVDDLIPFNEAHFADLCSSASAGDSQAIWSINSLRGKSVKYYTLATSFACAKVIVPRIGIIVFQW